MVLFIVLGVVVLAAIGIAGALFFLMDKESRTGSEVKVVPVNPADLVNPVSVARIEALEEELRAASEKGVTQAKESMAAIEALAKENEALKAAQADKSADAAAQQQIEQLRQDNGLLQTQVEAAQVKLTQLGEELQIANESMARLKSERDALAAQGSPAGELEGLRASNQQLKEANAKLIEEVQTLQYESARNRAQASGLEKICENYKMQLEQKA